MTTNRSTSLSSVSTGFCFVILLAACGPSGSDDPQAQSEPDVTPEQSDAISEDDQTEPALDAPQEHCRQGVCPVFDGEEVTELHDGAVYAISLLRDGGVATADGLSLRIWNVDNLDDQLDESRLVELDVPKRSPDEDLAQWLLPLGDDRLAITGAEVLIVDARSFEVLQRLPGADYIEVLDDQVFVTGARSGGLWFWDIDDLSEPVAESALPVEQLAVAQRVAYIGGGNTIYAWDGRTEPEVATEIDGVWRLASTLDGEQLLVGTEDGEVLLIDPETMATVETLSGLTENGVTSLIELEDGRIAAGGVEGGIGIWDIAMPQTPERLGNYSQQITQLAEIPGGPLLASVAGFGSDPTPVRVFTDY